MTKRSDPEGLLIRIRERTVVKPNGCHEFQSWNNSYGFICVNGRQESVHRLVYRLCVGEIPEGLLVRHSCDNPPCCNPEHLLVGTYKDNSNDCVSRGRFPSMRGPRKGARRKLDPAKAVEIRNLREEGVRIVALAPMFGVSISAIRDVLDRKTYYYV